MADANVVQAAGRSSRRAQQLSDIIDASIASAAMTDAMYVA
jgi:hypothetical protein